MTVFELLPVTVMQDKLPAFRSRYDNSTNEIDTDIILDSARSYGRSQFEIERDFKGSRNGYSGHHTKVITALRKYEIELKVNQMDFAQAMHEGVVFQGSIILDRLTFDRHVTLNISGLSVAASATVTKKEPNQR